jgi:hypothetical protein
MQRKPAGLGPRDDLPSVFQKEFMTNKRRSVTGSAGEPSAPLGTEIAKCAH